jgi:predicted metal-dependent phosphotriesterase family hydrolase
MDRNPDPWLHRQIANTGAFLSFDGISRIKYHPSTSVPRPSWRSASAVIKSRS